MGSVIPENPAEASGPGALPHAAATQERDIWWGGYSGRALVPSFVLCGILTVVIAAVAWFVWYQYGLPARRTDLIAQAIASQAVVPSSLGAPVWPQPCVTLRIATLDAFAPALRELRIRYTAYLFVGPLWLWQLGRSGYFLFTFAYRLTTRRLLCERHFVGAPIRSMELAQIANVVPQRRGWDRLTGVGGVRIVAENAEVPDLVLHGVYRPHRVATVIREAVQQARASQVEK
jgi:hypothetical protein